MKTESEARISSIVRVNFEPVNRLSLVGILRNRWQQAGILLEPPCTFPDDVRFDLQTNAGWTTINLKDRYAAFHSRNASEDLAGFVGSVIDLIGDRITRAELNTATTLRPTDTLNPGMSVWEKYPLNRRFANKAIDRVLGAEADHFGVFHFLDNTQDLDADDIQARKSLLVERYLNSGDGRVAIDLSTYLPLPIFAEQVGLKVAQDRAFFSEIIKALSPFY
jgi:hypothetical protein